MTKITRANYTAALSIILLSSLVGCVSNTPISKSTQTARPQTEPSWTLPSDLQIQETPKYNHTFGWPDGPNDPVFKLISDEEVSFAISTHDDRIVILCQKYTHKSHYYSQHWFDLEYQNLFTTSLGQYLRITQNTDGASGNIADAFMSTWTKPFPETFLLLHDAGLTSEEPSRMIKSDISPELYSILWALMDLENQSRAHYPENVQPSRNWEWCVGNLADDGKMLVSLTYHRWGKLAVNACLVDSNMAPKGILTCYINDAPDKGIPPGIMTLLHGFAYHTQTSSISESD